MDQIKSSFQKVKQDIDNLKEEISSLTISFIETKKLVLELRDKINFVSSENRVFQKIGSLNPPINAFNLPTDNPTNQQFFPTIPTDNPTNQHTIRPLNTQNLPLSIGNEGVPTNQQTNQQTNQHIENGSFDNAATILSSLDNIKKELRNKFKRLTEQEFLVFSTLYQLSELGEIVDYKNLSERIGLTETSIRDYIGKLIKKGIPIFKNKQNNKLVQLSLSENLTKIASLPLILQLRGL